MKIALDSSVILDVLTDDPSWADASEAALKRAFSTGSLLVGECVLAEITPALGEKELERFLSDWKIQFVPSTRESSRLAGTMFRKYVQRSQAIRCVLPDFLIGAHALCLAGRLLARDRGYYRDYFSGLTVVEPE